MDIDPGCAKYRGTRPHSPNTPSTSLSVSEGIDVEQIPQLSQQRQRPQESQIIEPDESSAKHRELVKVFGLPSIQQIGIPFPVDWILVVPYMMFPVCLRRSEHRKGAD